MSGGKKVTMNTRLNGLLDWLVEDVPLPPYFDGAFDFELDFAGGTSICRCCGFGDDLEDVSVNDAPKCWGQRTGEKAMLKSSRFLALDCWTTSIGNR